MALQTKIFNNPCLKCRSLNSLVMIPLHVPGVAIPSQRSLGIVAPHNIWTQLCGYCLNSPYLLPPSFVGTWQLLDHFDNILPLLFKLHTYLPLLAFWQTEKEADSFILIDHNSRYSEYRGDPPPSPMAPFPLAPSSISTGQVYFSCLLFSTFQRIKRKKRFLELKLMRRT